MESGLSAAIDVDCTTLMGLDSDVISKAIILKNLLVEICRAFDVSNSVTLKQNIVAVILHASYSSCSKRYSHPMLTMLIGRKFYLPETSPP